MKIARKSQQSGLNVFISNNTITTTTVTHHGPQSVLLLHLHPVALFVEIDPLVVAVVVLHSVPPLTLVVARDAAAVPAVLI